MTEFLLQDCLLISRYGHADTKFVLCNYTDNLTVFYYNGRPQGRRERGAWPFASPPPPQIIYQKSISSAFYAHIFRQYFGAKKCQTQNTILKFLAQKYQRKRACKMLIKLTPGVNPIKLCFPNFEVKLECYLNHKMT